MDPKNSPIQNYLSYALAAAHRKVSTSLNARLRKHGIQVEAWRILETLEAGDRLTMGELAEIVLMNPPTLTKLVDRLVSDGLVHRQVARNDHRQVNVLPTALGRKRMVQIRQEIQDQDAMLLEKLGDSQSQQLIQLLRGIV
ncbi:MarR family winged helix-turn-helix transcriptional regulator [Roseibium sp. AS2]|uniref:MarR family winged helix-turn-helix transcriptional regulator n=1 Tax=Roseibium sp. AS2 TaxID=3135781 RepID=UPI0031793705